jgi:hypothetical protein
LIKGKTRYDQAHTAPGQLMIAGRQLVRGPAVVVTHAFPGGRITRRFFKAMPLMTEFSNKVVMMHVSL